jgi:hypothetical protein
MRTLLLRGAAAATILLAPLAGAAPLTADEIRKLCTDADGPASCGRRIEAEQQKRLPGLVKREGDVLVVSLFPSGSTTFTDTATPAGGKSFALWDSLSEINAVVLWTMSDDDTGFLLLQRATGRQTPLPAEPVLSPDRQRLATADFCPKRCTNLLTVWRVNREGVVREADWRPETAWSDAAVTWKGEAAVALEYTPADGKPGGTREVRLADPGWTRPAGR